MKTLFALFLSFIVSPAFANELHTMSHRVPISGQYRIESGRKSLQVKLTNPSLKEFFCPIVWLKVDIVGDEFNDPTGSIDLKIYDLHLKPNDQVVFESVGQQEILQYSSDPAFIQNVTLNYESCRAMTFVDYCRWSEKSDLENQTIAHLFQAAKTSDCELIEESIGENLKLDRSGISELKPISYLTNLKALSINQSNVVDLSPIKALRKLKRLSVNNNPIVDLTPALELPSIQKISARTTLVPAEAIIVMPVTLISLDLWGTPYAKANRGGK